MEIVSDRVTFTGSLGYPLAGRLDRPKGDVRAYALYASCFTCTKDILAAKRICSTLATHGIATLRFDFTGLGASGGAFEDTTFSSAVQDLEAAVAYLNGRTMSPFLMVGHSLGGSAALVATHRLRQIQAVVTLNAPCYPDHVERRFQEVEEELLWTGEADVQIEGRPFRIKQQFIDDLKRHNMPQILQNLRAALLVFHAPLDETVSLQNAHYIFTMAKHPKSFVSLDQADHLITKPSDASFIGEVISAWASRYF